MNTAGMKLTKHQTDAAKMFEGARFHEIDRAAGTHDMLDELVDGVGHDIGSGLG